MQCRSWIRQPPEENLQRSEGVSTDRRRERSFRHPKRFQARRSDVQPAVQHGTAVLIKKRNTTMAKEKGMGIYLSDQERDCLTNLRFADDVMLFATSKEQLRNMMYEFKKATEIVGLGIHPDKTKILSNQSTLNSNTKRHFKVGEMSIEILTKNESVKYLGQRISFHQQETLEIKSRIRAAWTTFHKYRQELTSKNTCSNSVYASSTAQFLRDYATQQEHGHRAKNTKE